MPRRTNIFCWLAAILILGAALAMDGIHTASTAVEIEPADNAVTLVSLRQGGDAFNWCASPATISFIATATIDGREMPLHWHRVTGNESAKSPCRLTYTFKCDEPALELTSTWTASDGPGPVEHEIVI